MIDPRSAARQYGAGEINLLAERDKHLAQLMAIHGQAVFTVLGLVFTVLLGLEKIRDLDLPACWIVLISIFLFGGVFSLFGGALRLSFFHTGQIRSFQRRLADQDKNSEPSEWATRPCGDFEIIGSRGNFFLPIAAGIGALVVAALLLMGYAATRDPVGIGASSSTCQVVAACPATGGTVTQDVTGGARK